MHLPSPQIAEASGPQSPALPPPRVHVQSRILETLCLGPESHLPGVKVVSGVGRKLCKACHWTGLCPWVLRGGHQTLRISLVTHNPLASPPGIMLRDEVTQDGSSSPEGATTWLEIWGSEPAWPSGRLGMSSLMWSVIQSIGLCDETHVKTRSQSLEQLPVLKQQVPGGQEALHLESSQTSPSVSLHLAGPHLYPDGQTVTINTALPDILPAVSPGSKPRGYGNPHMCSQWVRVDGLGTSPPSARHLKAGSHMGLWTKGATC